MSIEERQIVLNGMRDRSIKLVACTSLLGVVLDLGFVTCVIHYGYPWSMVNFAQEIGRLGLVALDPLGLLPARYLVESFQLWILLVWR